MFPPELVVQNVWFANNEGGNGATSTFAVSALYVSGIHLTLRPSSTSVVCGGAGSSCVQFEGNGLGSGTPPAAWVPLVWVFGGARLVLERARITGNTAQETLVYASYFGPNLVQRSSIVDNNVVTGSNGVLYLLSSSSGDPASVAFLQHNTITANAHARFFRLDEHSALTSQGNVLHAATAKPLRDGSAPPGNLTLQYCNYLTTLADAGYTGATQVADGFGALVSVTGALSLGAGFAPPLALIDQCRTPQVFPAASTLVDYAGQLFAMPFAPANPNRTADLGAIEYRPDGMFANGFE